MDHNFGGWMQLLLMRTSGGGMPWGGDGFAAIDAGSDFEVEVEKLLEKVI